MYNVITSVRASWNYTKHKANNEWVQGETAQQQSEREKKKHVKYKIAIMEYTYVSYIVMHIRQYAVMQQAGWTKAVSRRRIR